MLFQKNVRKIALSILSNIQTWRTEGCTAYYIFLCIFSLGVGLKKKKKVNFLPLSCSSIGMREGEEQMLREQAVWAQEPFRSSSRAPQLLTASAWKPGTSFLRHTCIVLNSHLNEGLCWMRLGCRWKGAKSVHRKASKRRRRRKKNPRRPIQKPDVTDENSKDGYACKLETETRGDLKKSVRVGCSTISSPSSLTLRSYSRSHFWVDKRVLALMCCGFVYACRTWTSHLSESLGYQIVLNKTFPPVLSMSWKNSRVILCKM